MIRAVVVGAGVVGASVAFRLAQTGADPEEGWLDPVLCAHAMVQATLRARATLRTGTRVTRIGVEKGRVTGVGTAGGDLIPADVVVNCADLPAARDLVRRAARILPAVEGAGVEAVRIGVRPMPADGFSVVGPVRHVEGFYIAVTHSGVTLAPFLGRAAADEIASGKAEPWPAPFRPDRVTPSTSRM